MVHAANSVGLSVSPDHVAGKPLLTPARARGNIRSAHFVFALLHACGLIKLRVDTTHKPQTLKLVNLRAGRLTPDTAHLTFSERYVLCACGGFAIGVLFMLIIAALTKNL